MGRWDYEVVALTHGTLGWHKGEIHRRDLEEVLDEKGQEGFELVHIWLDQKMHHEKDGHVLIFKRYIPD